MKQDKTNRKNTYANNYEDAFGIPAYIQEAFGITEDEFECEEEMEEVPYFFPLSYEDFLYEVEDNVLGQDHVMADIVYDIYSYMKGYLEQRVSKHNFLIAGPSASGKTELYRTISRIFKKYDCPIPVLQVDITRYSPTGFQGEELSNIPKIISDAGSSGAAIVFLDEFDKILFPLKDANNTNFHGVLQNELLGMIEGKEYTIRQKGMSYVVDTSKTLFIALGAFTDFRIQEKNPIVEKHIGFITEEPQIKPIEDNVTLSMDSLLTVGGKIELLGRFDQVYNFYPLSEDIFEKLFEHILFNLSVEQQVLLRSTPEAIQEFTPLAKTDFGCREVKRKVYETIRPCLRKIVDYENRIELVIILHGLNKAEIKKRKNKKE